MKHLESQQFDLFSLAVPRLDDFEEGPDTAAPLAIVAEVAAVRSAPVVMSRRALVAAPVVEPRPAEPTMPALLAAIASWDDEPQHLRND